MNLQKDFRFAFIGPVLWFASVVVWFSVFPIKNSFSSSDILFEGVYLLAAMVSFFLVLRLGEWKLSLGWSALCEGLLFDFLDEFTREAGFRLDVDVMQDIATTVGILLMTFGFLGAASRREKERDSVQRSADALNLARERLVSILESVSDGIIVTEISGEVQLLNANALQMVGEESDSPVGRPMSELLNLNAEGLGEIVALRKDAFSRPLQAAFGVDIKRQMKGGKQILSVGVSAIHESSNATGLVWVIRDVTRRREQEGFESQASRLESVGLLAGGVAHDFNNLLSAVMNWVSYSEVTQGQDPDLLETFEEIRKACKRGKSLANQLLSFAKGGEPVAVPTDLAALVREEVIFALRGSKVSPTFQVEKKLAHAEVDPVQMGQVVQNLIINAKQAMPSGGKVEIGIQQKTVSSKDSLPLDAGEYIEIWIQDEGQGISKQDCKHIFDPYFSRKQGGSGLGLATAYSIIRRHRGHIWVESTGNSGTTFRVLLPQSTARAATKKGEVDRRLFHGKSVLVVDDDYSVQRPLVGTLKAIGFDVEACIRGRDALQLYRERLDGGNPYDLVLMDLTLQGESGGAETMKQILGMHPQARGIVMSGYHEDPVMANFKAEGFSGVMQKPFDYSLMVGEMGRVLELRPDGERS